MTSATIQVADRARLIRVPTMDASLPLVPPPLRDP